MITMFGVAAFDSDAALHADASKAMMKLQREKVMLVPTTCE
jgi:hypothetical protein